MGITQIIATIIDLILPPRCVVTGEIVDGIGTISGQIWQDISFIDKPNCAICGLPFDFYLDTDENTSICGSCIEKKPLFDKARSAIIYDDNTKSIILAFKYGDRLNLKTSFSNWIIRIGKEVLLDSDIIVPVPLHRRRLWQRRYNQSAILSAEIAKNFSDIEHIPQLLKRTRQTTPQKGLSKKERHLNIAGSIAVKEKYLDKITGKNICIIDDVYTSGATINECAKILKKAGAKNVYALTIARVIL